MKKIVCFGVFSLFVLGMTGSLLAMDADCADKDKSTCPYMQNKSGAVDVGNKICPVTGEEIDEKTKATYEYEGKIYNFCCPMCINTFKQDPQKYIKIIEEERGRGNE